MIHSIRVKGFKSLNNLALSFRKGINILVGPNGSGKTNIISFFEFLSHLIQNDLSEAVSLVGGAGSIFTKIGENDFTDSINVKILGFCNYDKKRYLNYHYSFIIKVSIQKGLIYFENQKLQISLSHGNKIKDLSTIDKSQLDLDLEVKTLPNFKIETTLKKIDRRKIRSPFGDRNSHKELERQYSSGFQRQGFRSLIQTYFRYLEPVGRIFIDLLGGETFNIIPSRIKLPEDIAKQPGIQKDGTGLAATLFAIRSQKSSLITRRFISFPFLQRKRFSPKTYNQIVELTKLANESIDSIEVDNDPFINNLTVKITINTKQGKIILPLSAMSDGTIKWITLITAILTSSQIFSIEEPENFLHPWMQSEIVKIMRNTYEDKLQDSLIIMSTHSETLLNSAKPEEIILIYMEDGFTKAKRISNTKLLSEEISKTGFGLGYYYITGIISNE
jgi:predicted ATPase